MTEAEVGVMWPRAKECGASRHWKRGRNRLGSLRKEPALRRLDFSPVGRLLLDSDPQSFKTLMCGV